MNGLEMWLRDKPQLCTETGRGVWPQDAQPSSQPFRELGPIPLHVFVPGTPICQELSMRRGRGDPGNVPPSQDGILRL